VEVRTHALLGGQALRKMGFSARWSNTERVGPQATMSNYNGTTEKRIAREHITDPIQFGVDGHGAVHFTSLADSHQIAVVDGRSVETYHLSETPYEHLMGWARHVQTKRGAWQESPSVVSGEDLLEALA